MSALQRVRQWAEDNGHEIKLERGDAKDHPDPNVDHESVSGEVWYMAVSLDEPFRFQATSGWQDTVETAAHVLVEQLISVGEDVPE
jgi:hypothetical protein